jgi:hypothetical protein
MSQEKCDAEIGIMADEPRRYYSINEPIPHTIFKCTLDANHEGRHQTCGSIIHGSSQTDYVVQWWSSKEVQEAKQ